MFGSAALRRWFRGDEGPAGAAGLGLAAPDLAELAALGTRVEAEYGTSSPAVLGAALTRLERRQVPLRGVSPAPDGGVGGLRFADGTVVLVRGWHAGDLGRLAAGLYRGPVHLDAHHCEQGRMVVELSYAGHRDRLRALGVTDPV